MTLGEARMMLAIQAQSADADDLKDFHEILFGKTPDDPESERDRISDACAELPPEKVVAVWNRIGYEAVYLAHGGEILPVPASEPVKAPTRLWRAVIASSRYGSARGQCLVEGESVDSAIAKFWARDIPKIPADAHISFDEVKMFDGVETTIYGV